MICLPYTMMFGWTCQSVERPLNTMFHTTLWDRVSKRVPLSAKDGGKPKLTVEDEKKLIEYAQDRAKKGIGFSKFCW